MLPACADFVEMMGGLPSLTAEILETAIQDILTKSAEVHQMLANGDLEMAGRVLHALRGGADTLGAHDFAPLLREIEAHCTAEEGDAARALLPSFEQLTIIYQGELDRLLQEVKLLE